MGRRMPPDVKLNTLCFMIHFIPKQYNNAASPYNGRYYAYPVIDETVDLEGLAKHMAEHNSGFSEPVCIGVMKGMVKCAKEMILEGKNVKINDLAIFSCGIVNVLGGAESEKAFRASTHIKGIKLRARATGELSNANLNLGATLRKVTTYVSGTVSDEDPTDPGTDPDTEEPIVDNGTGGSDTGGSDAGGGSDNTGGGSDNAGGGSDNTGGGSDGDVSAF